MAQPAPGEVSTPAHHPVHLSDTTINTSPSTHDTSTPDPLQPYRGGSQQASSHELTDKAVPPGSGTSLPSPLLPDLMITASHDSTGTADCKNAAPTSDAAHIHKLPSGLEETIAPGATAWITPDNSQTSDSAHVHDGYDNVRDYLDKTMRNADRDGGPYAVEQALRSLEKGLGSDHKLAYRFFQKPSSGQEFVSATLDDHVNSTVELFRNNEVKTLLWKAVVANAYRDMQPAIFNVERNHLGKTLLERIVDMSVAESTPKTRAELLRKTDLIWPGLIESTEPVNRELVEEPIMRLYRAAECRPPHTVLWFKSPRAGAIAAALYELALKVQLEQYGRPQERRFSGVQKYLEDLKMVVKVFPDYIQDTSDGFKFPEHWSQRDDSDPNKAACARLLRGWFWHRRTLLWDAIKANRNTLIGEVDDAVQSLKEAFSAKDPSILDFETDSIFVDKLNIHHYMELLLDDVRLGMAGYRSVLKSIGIYPYDDDGLEDILHNCGGFIPFDDLVIAVERPSSVHRNDRNRLHNPTGPSIEYEDGWRLYSIDGVNVPPRFITDPSQIRLQDIQEVRNAELRRLLVDRYGAERFIRDCGATAIDESEYGILYSQTEGRQPFAMVRVINRSPEPDGSFKEYFLEVPPDTATARQAVAWTFEMGESEYKPSVET